MSLLLRKRLKTVNDYKDQNLKSAIMTAGIVISVIIAIAIYVAIN